MTCHMVSVTHWSLPHVCEANLMAAKSVMRTLRMPWGENVYGLPVREAAQMAVVAIRCLSVDVGYSK